MDSFEAFESLSGSMRQVTNNSFEAFESLSGSMRQVTDMAQALERQLEEFQVTLLFGSSDSQNRT